MKIVRHGEILEVRIRVLADNLYHFYVDGIPMKPIATHREYDMLDDAPITIHTLETSAKTLEDIEALVENEAVYEIDVVMHDALVDMYGAMFPDKEEQS